MTAQSTTAAAPAARRLSHRLVHPCAGTGSSRRSSSVSPRSSSPQSRCAERRRQPQTTEEWADAVARASPTGASRSRRSPTSAVEPLTAETLADKLDDAEDATSDLVAEPRDLGPPDLEEGDELEEQLDARPMSSIELRDADTGCRGRDGGSGWRSSCRPLPRSRPTSRRLLDGDLGDRRRPCRTRTSVRSRRRAPAVVRRCSLVPVARGGR